VLAAVSETLRLRDAFPAGAIILGDGCARGGRGHAASWNGDEALNISDEGALVAARHCEIGGPSEVKTTERGGLSAIEERAAVGRVVDVLDLNVDHGGEGSQVQVEDRDVGAS